MQPAGHKLEIPIQKEMVDDRFETLISLKIYYTTEFKNNEPDVATTVSMITHYT